MTVLIDNQWQVGEGTYFESTNPYNDDILWCGNAASEKQVLAAVTSAASASFMWRQKSIHERISAVNAFIEKLSEQSETFAYLIASETGKPLWEAKTEAAAMIAKANISVRAYDLRTGFSANALPAGQALVRHYPIGTFAILGPYNFPGHLPNGHIIPALLAGNTVVLKPSELTPKVAEEMVKLWCEVLPKGVLNLVQGKGDVGKALCAAEAIDGVLFTGSAKTGFALHEQFAGKPEKMLALEMGGNNPLVVSAHFGELDACVYQIIQSAFITSGQRCTCARRLFLPQGEKGDAVLARLIQTTQKLAIGDPLSSASPFLGTLISSQAAEHVLHAEEAMIAQGGVSLLQAKHLKAAQLSPGIVDMTKIQLRMDEEIFGPLLQVMRYQHLDDAIDMANSTRFGLSAGLISTEDAEWDTFIVRIRAGIVNRNLPLTGASGEAPFGGLGASGNFRPSAFYAADYCAYPVASMEHHAPVLPSTLSPGIDFNK